MADYTGARTAIRARFTTAWGSTTPIGTQNRGKPVGWSGAWPPVDGDGIPRKWVYLEILSDGSQLAASSGTPGNQLWEYTGLINAHVFVPVGTDDEDATVLAIQAGEIFRAAKFYEGPDGRCIRCMAPAIDDGDSADDDGNWFRVTMSVPFTYWHRG